MKCCFWGNSGAQYLFTTIAFCGQAADLNSKISLGNVNHLNKCGNSPYPCIQKIGCYQYLTIYKQTEIRAYP